MKFDPAPVIRSTPLIRPIFLTHGDRSNRVPLYEIKITFPWVTPLELLQVATRAVFTRFCPQCLSFKTIIHSEVIVAICGRPWKDLLRVNDESVSYLNCLF